MKSDHPNKSIWILSLGIWGVVFAANALCSVSSFGWILGWYLLIGYLIMYLMALIHDNIVINGGILFSLLLQVIDFARHDFYIVLFFRWFSMGEGYGIARFIVVTLLFIQTILAAIACSRLKCFEKLAAPPLIESVSMLIFINSFLYKNALVANVLGTFMIICIFVRSKSRLAFAKFIIGCLFLTLPYIGYIDSSILQIEGDPMFEISDYVVKLRSNCCIFFIYLAFVTCLLAICLCQRHKGRPRIKPKRPGMATFQGRMHTK